HTPEVSGDVLEPDSPESYRGLLLPPGLGDDDDRPRALEDRPGPGRVAPAEANVDAAGQVGAGEVGRVARVQELGVAGGEREHLVQGERLQLLFERLAEPRPLPRVE